MNKCSFCGRTEKEVNVMISGINGFICDECIRRGYEVLTEMKLDDDSLSHSKSEHHFNLKEVPKPT